MRLGVRGVKVRYLILIVMVIIVGAMVVSNLVIYQQSSLVINSEFKNLAIKDTEEYLKAYPQAVMEKIEV